jgi:hypothetical protein
MEYPKIKEGCDTIKVIVTLSNGGKYSAMFYWNGKEPRFASFGSNITSKVVFWEYLKNEEKQYEKKI